MFHTVYLFAVGKIDPVVNNIPQVSGNDLITNILNTAYFVAGMIAVVVIIIAGVMYVSSTGDANRVKIAKNTLTYAIVGLIVIMSAFGITNFVAGRFS